MSLGIASAALVVWVGIAVRPRGVARRPPARTAVNEPDHRSDPRTPRSSGARRRLRRQRPLDPNELATWCEMMARALQGGATLTYAVAHTPRSPRIDEVIAPTVLALERGSSLAAALPRSPRHGAPLDLVLVVLRACSEHGGGSAEPISRAASALRQRAALEAERRTHSAQATLSAHVMTWLPGVMLVITLLTSSTVRASSATPIGITSIALGATLNLIGWRWMRALIAGAGR